jgi:hypothetical protein
MGVRGHVRALARRAPSSVAGGYLPLAIAVLLRRVDMSRRWKAATRRRNPDGGCGEVRPLESRPRFFIDKHLKTVIRCA